MRLRVKEIAAKRIEEDENYDLKCIVNRVYEEFGLDDILEFQLLDE